jgi:outer membrane cobalamin receptor
MRALQRSAAVYGRRRQAWTRKGAKLVAALVSVGGLHASPVRAQADSALHPHRLEEQVVVGHRAPTLKREGMAAITVLDRPALDRLPARTLADALRYVPGLTFLSRDGTGELPMAIARGFFGGGETEYVLLTVDGVPSNDLRTGLVEWTQIPLGEIERIEVLRGGGSVAYGDAALGAVVNVTTRKDQVPRQLTSEVRLGNRGDRALQSSFRRIIGSDRLLLGMALGRVDGFRSHAEASNEAVSGSYVRHADRPTSAYVRAGVQRLRNEEPGPLAPEQIERNPRVANPLFLEDQRRRDALELGAGVSRTRPRTRLTVDTRLRLADDEQTRTLPLTTNAGDTQFHDARSWDLWARVQYSHRTGGATIVAGTEAEGGTYDSRYTDAFDRAQIRSRGDGERTKLGQYAELQQRLGARLRGVAGLRFDLVRLDGTGARAPSRFSLWSPRLGLNLAYAASGSHVGNLYVTWTRSFKAPAPYQLYDVRLIAPGAPGEEISLSNPELRPQHSSGLEAGIYHTLGLGARAFAEVTLSAYRMDVTDEIDFDLRTFKYGNILESRHDGVEASVMLDLTSWLSFRHALTLSRVTFRSGESIGNRLKNIPGTVATNAMHLAVGHLDGTVTHRFIGGFYLDDANREPLPGSHHLDASISWNFGAVRALVAGMDLVGSRASTGGFLVYDVARDLNVPLLYPGGGRSFRVGAAIAR